jgi:hypothetical protein
MNLLVKLSQAPAMSCTENSKFTAIPTGVVSSTSKRTYKVYFTA